MATITSNGTGGGDSDVGASWSGGIVPVEGDKVNISAGDTITLEADHIWGDDTTTAINVQGVLKASRSTSQTLTCKGTLKVYNGGEIDYGKSGGDEVPTGVYATMKLNYSAALSTGKYGLLIDDASSKLKTFGGTRTVNTTLNGAISAGATSATVTDATGWEAGDTIILGPTSSTVAGHDVITLDTVNTGTGAITWTGGTTYAHADGCYCSNMSSNVTITSYNTSYCGGVQIEGNTGTGADDRHEMQYTAFRYLRSYSPGDGGVCFYFRPTLGDYYVRAVAHCSFYANTDNKAVFSLSRATLPTLTITDCAFFNTTTGSEGMCYLGVQGPTAKFSGCRFYGGGSTYCIVSSNGQGGVGMNFTDCEFMGATTLIRGVPAIAWSFTTSKFLSATYAVSITQGGKHTFDTCDFGVGPGTPTVAYAFVLGQGTNQLNQFICEDGDFSGVATSLYSGTITSAHPDHVLIIANKNRDPAQQFIYSTKGTWERDASVYRTGAPSLKGSPLSDDDAMTLTFNIVAPDSTPVVVTGFLRKNSSYNGSVRPKVTLSGLGITASSYTMTDVDDTWEQFVVSGMQTSGTDGVLRLTIAFQGTAGSAWVDDISAPAAVAVNTGEFGYWSEGQPVKLIAANFVAPVDVWNVQKTDAQVSGSMGESVQNTERDVGDNQALIIAGL